jgi:hypothetical protein
MRACDIWKNASDAEFDNAMEGMEKLVMNRLYELFVPYRVHSLLSFLIWLACSTFTPQVAHAVPPRPITADDLERDRVLSQRIALFGWIEEKHLDLPEGEGSAGFLMFAQQGQLFLPHRLVCAIDKSTRTSQDQPLQSTSRQANMYSELLQGHLWSVFMFDSSKFAR